MNKALTILSRFAVEPVAPAASDAAVTVAAIFSDDSVGRDGNRFFTAGMSIDAFMENPVVPYGHCADEPPVGKVMDLTKTKGQLRGVVRFTSADLYPFGAMIGRMYRDGFLNAFSVSIIPTEWKYAADKSRNGGIDITKSDLLEISSVPVPALATALVKARSRGLDVSAATAWAERRLDIRSGGPSAIHDLCRVRRAALGCSAYRGEL